MTQALYRRWRPQTWDEVVGQEHVVQTLRNAVRGDRCGARLPAGRAARHGQDHRRPTAGESRQLPGRVDRPIGRATPASTARRSTPAPSST